MRTSSFLCRHLADGLGRLMVVFGLDGEPLLAPGLLRRVGEECLALREEFPETDARCSINTSGSLFSDETLSLLEELDLDVGVSLDGPKAIHDGARPLRGGRGSYDQILPGLRFALHSQRPKLSGVTAYATLTAEHPVPTVVVRHLVGMGFAKVAVKPARLPYDHLLALNEASLPRFIAGYEEYASFLRQALLADLERWRPALNGSDLFTRFLLRTAARMRVHRRCPAGRGMLAIDTQGRLFPCASIACDDGEAAIGDVESGVSESWQETPSELHIEGRACCRPCFARYLCGGGCYHMARLANGDIRRPDAVKCKVVRRLCELAASVFCDVAERAPDVAARLRAVAEEELLQTSV